jgi:hypothetical protein
MDNCKRHVERTAIPVEKKTNEIARGSRSGAPFAGVPALPGRLRRRLPLGAEAEAAVG